MIKQALAALVSKDRSPHIALVEQIAALIKPRVYLEVGVYRCSTINRVAKHASTAIGVDINQDALSHARGKNIETVHGDLNVARPSLEKYRGLIDLAFIDGDHRIESLRSDFELLSPYVSNSAAILIHDTWPGTREYSSDLYCSNSYLFPNEINDAVDRMWSAATLAAHPGLTMVTRRGILPSWCDQVSS